MDTTAKVTLTGTRPGKKRIAIFLDGTWNTVNDNTNVWRLKSLLADAGSDGVPQIGYYQKGVGTTFGSYFLGGVLGSGLQDEIITAYEWLIDHYSEGDELFIFGFTRARGSSRPLASVAQGDLQLRAAFAVPLAGFNGAASSRGRRTLEKANVIGTVAARGVARVAS